MSASVRAETFVVEVARRFVLCRDLSGRTVRSLRIVIVVRDLSNTESAVLALDSENQAYLARDRPKVSHRIGVLCIRAPHRLCLAPRRLYRRHKTRQMQAA